LDVVDQRLEQDVLVEAVVVEPEGVALLARLHQPVDRCLSAALGVPPYMVVPEAAPSRPSGGIASLLYPPNLAGFSLDGFRFFFPNQFKHSSHQSDDVARMVLVVGNHPLQHWGKGIVFRHLRKMPPSIILKHGRSGRRQSIKEIWLTS